MRIVTCFLPKESPWHNVIEPKKWVHGKRKVVEPEALPGVLTFLHKLGTYVLYGACLAAAERGRLMSIRNPRGVLLSVYLGQPVEPARRSIFGVRDKDLHPHSPGPYGAVDLLQLRISAPKRAYHDGLRVLLAQLPGALFDPRAFPRPCASPSVPRLRALRLRWSYYARLRSVTALSSSPRAKPGLD